MVSTLDHFMKGQVFHLISSPGFVELPLLTEKME